MNRVSGPREVFEAVRRFYRGADREILSVLCLDSRNQPTAFNIVSVGSLNTTRTRPSDILKPAILSNSLSIILVHNHPSGNLEPSRDDIEFTQSVRRASELMGIELFDHLIISDKEFVSLKEIKQL